MVDDHSAYSLDDKSQTWAFFDRISGRYDLLNRVLSMGIDVYWRKKVAKRLPKAMGLNAVDLGTGTGDFMLTLVRKQPPKKFRSYRGIDPAEKMLQVGREKMKKYRFETVMTFEKGDATALSLETSSADVVTMSFAIRNVPDVSKCLSEIHRILTPGGVGLILEFSLPKNKVIKAIYLFYFRKILPFVGGLLSGDRAAYLYLNQSVEAFPYGEAFCSLMQEAGFVSISATPLTFGIATLYQGTRK